MNTNKKKWCLLAYSVIFVLPLIVYLYKYSLHQIGADFLVRIAESKYFLARINPYEVFVGVKPLISAYGPEPAVYSFFSYIFAAALTKISNVSQIQLLIFIFVDFGSFLLGFFLLNKITQSYINNKTDSLKQAPKLILVLIFSTFFWQHVYFLNYTLVSMFGLILLIFGIFKKSWVAPLVGMALIGLRPSLAIPVFIYLFFGRHWKILCMSIVEYFGVLLFASWRLNTGPIELLKQLAEIQSHFSQNLGYYHAEGAFSILQPLLGSYMTVLSILMVCVIINRFRSYLSNPLVAIILISACSVSFFYTQVHAWISVYPILLIALIDGAKRNRLDLSILILIGWFLIPRLSSYVPEMYRYDYVVIYNLCRFGALWYAVLILVNRLINSDKNVVVHSNSTNVTA
jgi:hypothetical protein